MKPNIRTPPRPSVEDVVLWETNIKAFTVRQLPPSESKFLDWVVVMLGPGKSKMVDGYWSGTQGAFGQAKRPKFSRGDTAKLLAQQGGWMATREQLARMNSGLCNVPSCHPSIHRSTKVMV